MRRCYFSISQQEIIYIMSYLIFFTYLCLMVFIVIPSAIDFFMKLFSVKYLDPTQEMIFYLRVIFVSILSLPFILHILTFKMNVVFLKSRK